MREITLPNRYGKDGVENIFVQDNLIIVGANGTGKSRLGTFIETHIPNSSVKRVSAQRTMNIPYESPVMSYEQAQNHLLNNWRYKTVTEIQDDYIYVLSTLFSETSKRNSEFVKLCQDNESNFKPNIPESAIEKLIRIWKDILPQRELEFKDSKISVKAPKINPYDGNQMSDGEKVALYLISQCLLVPKNYTIIIDEPELHLHKSLMSRLWNKLEAERHDCLFVYITHDLDFAASRVKATKIWVQNYLNNFWTWDIVPENIDIPENLLLEIIGSRKPVLFVEGEKGKLDDAIYQYCYPEYTIIPRGGCQRVIESTKGIRNNTNLHTITAYGLIDRDYREQKEIDSLRKKGIFTIDVAEVENILITPKVVRIVAEHQALNPNEIFKKVSEHIISSLKDNIEKEISYSCSLEINFRLNNFDNNQKGTENIKNAISSIVESINVEEIYNKYYQLYLNIIEKYDIELALRHYNHKGLLAEVSKFFELTAHGYSALILRLIRSGKGEEIIKALHEYLPKAQQFTE